MLPNLEASRLPSRCSPMVLIIHSKSGEYACTPVAVTCNGGKNDNSMELAQLFVEHSAQLSCRDDEGDTPLHLACFAGKVEIVQYLLGQGADTTLQNDAGRTLIQEAYHAYQKHGDERFAKVLQVLEEIIIMNLESISTMGRPKSIITCPAFIPAILSARHW
jgi:hypothetical protein